MIFYKVIKYKILEYAIDVLFNRIFVNTRSDVKIIQIKELQAGMVVKSIEYGAIYGDCIISNVDWREDTQDYRISMYFKTCSEPGMYSNRSRNKDGNIFVALCPDGDGDITICL